MDKCRLQFEQWIRSLPFVLNLGFDEQTQQYVLQEDRDMWAAWKASRKALTIELPALEDLKVPLYGEGYFVRYKDRLALEAQGFKVEE